MMLESEKRNIKVDHSLWEEYIRLNFTFLDNDVNQDKRIKTYIYDNRNILQEYRDDRHALDIGNDSIIFRSRIYNYLRQTPFIKLGSNSFLNLVSSTSDILPVIELGNYSTVEVRSTRNPAKESTDFTEFCKIKGGDGCIISLSGMNTPFMHNINEKDIRIEGNRFIFKWTCDSTYAPINIISLDGPVYVYSKDKLMLDIPDKYEAYFSFSNLFDVKMYNILLKDIRDSAEREADHAHGLGYN